jgi:hypothetical protein
MPKPRNITLSASLLLLYLSLGFWIVPEKEERLVIQRQFIEREKRTFVFSHAIIPRNPEPRFY